jgi:hypothetical protein
VIACEREQNDISSYPGQSRFLHEHIGDRHGAQRVLLAQYVQKLLRRLDHFARRGDLAAQRGFLYRGGGDIGHQSEIGCFELVTLLLGLRFERFDGATVPPPMFGGRSRRTK